MAAAVLCAAVLCAAGLCAAGLCAAGLCAAGLRAAGLCAVCARSEALPFVSSTTHSLLLHRAVNLRDKAMIQRLMSNYEQVHQVRVTQLAAWEWPTAQAFNLLLGVLRAILTVSVRIAISFPERKQRRSFALMFH